VVDGGRFLVFDHDIGAYDTAIKVVLWWGGQLGDACEILARVLRVYLVAERIGREM
jgi:hypothetical protein